MPLPSLLTAAQLADLLKVEDVSFRQRFSQQSTGTAGGDIGYADRMVAVWQADIETGAMLHAEAEGIMAIINSRGGGLLSFLAYNYKLPYPATDPKGEIIGSTVPKLGAITNRVTVAFTSFPAGYELPVGTYFGILFDTSRYYLGQLAESKIANGAGAVSATSIWPPLPAGIVTGANVNFRKPVAKFKVEPNSAYPSTVGALHSRVRFSAGQTYKA